MQAPGDEVHSKRPMRPKEEHQPPHRYKGARPARLARARSLAHPIARACVAASRPPIPRAAARRSQSNAQRAPRSLSSISVCGGARHAWRVGLCVVHRGGASRPAGQNGGQPRSGYLAVARAGSLGPTRSYWRVSRTETPRFATTRLEPEPWAHEALVAGGAMEASEHGGGGGRRQAVQ